MTVDGGPCIDTHSHWMPPAYLAAVRELLETSPEMRRDYGAMLATAERPDAPLVALERRVAEMDEAGVDVSVIALPPPAATFGDAASARRIAAEANDAMLAEAALHPGRFAVLLALPLPSPEA